MKKLQKRISTLLAGILIMGMFLNPVNVKAAYYDDVTAGRTWSCFWGFDVVNITLHASGYSTASYGEVTGVWFTHWSIFPNFVSDKNTWTVETPNGEWARGTALRGAGFDTPIGVIGGSSTEFFQIYF